MTSRLHLVRIGTLGEIVGALATDTSIYPRGCPVVLRTARGLELGEVLSPPDERDRSIEQGGTILRRMSIEDDLLQARLVKNRQSALEACGRQIAKLGLPATLVDVECLFDGQTLIFYFLGPMTNELEALVSELAETYEAQAQLRQFAETLSHGCGPGCGTEAASGGGCGSCSAGCAVAGACSPPRERDPARR